MNCKVLTQGPDETWTAKWTAFLENASFPSHYTTPNFFVDPYVRGGERFAVLALKGDEITGVLTGVDSGKSIVSGLFMRPQICFGNDVDRSEAAESLVKGLYEKGGKDLKLVELYSWEPIGSLAGLGFREREFSGEHGTVVLDLTKGADEVFKGFSQTRRNEVRRAVKQNLVQVSEVRTLDELAELYEVSKDWHQRKGLAPAPFEDVRLAFTQADCRKLFIAKYNGKIIAGSSYRFCRGGIVEYAGNNSLVEYQKLRPNDLIGWRAIEWACAEGFRYFGMGGSHQFLRRFGGRVTPTYGYKLDRSFLKVHTLKEAAISLGTSILRRSPASVKSRLKQIVGRN